MTGSHYINHLDQQIELKYFSEPLQLKGRIGMRIWVAIHENIMSFERKIKQCKSVEEIEKLFK
jgi:hypothetical protein